MENILFLGDSLTAGYGLSDAAAQSFPALIQQKINDHKYAYQVINAGLSGDTSAGGLARLDYWLAAPISVFVLELGINDIIRGITAQTTQNNLQAIITKVKAKYPHAKMALMGMEIPIFIADVRAAGFKAIFRQLADRNQMTLVPFFLDGVAGHPHLNLRDGLHPSAAGYQVIADKVWPVLHKLLP